MASVEKRADGSRIVRYSPGGQPLLVPSPTRVEFLWLSGLDQMVLLRRHWSAAIEATEPCLCEPRCGSSRVDRLVATLLRTNHDTWEERLLILPEEGWRSFERSWLLNAELQPTPEGARCLLHRVGPKRNGRTTCQPQDWVKVCPSGFSVVIAAREQLHVAADYFGRGDELVEDETPQGKASAGKPRVPLGKPQKR